MSKIDALANVPEVNFIGNLALQEVKEQVASWYDQRYQELTGIVPVLSDSSPEKLLQYSIAMLGYQALQYINDKGQGELLPTSHGDYLDGLAANLGLVRKTAERATAQMRFTLSAQRTQATGVPAGTRIRTENSLYFNTVEYAEIPAGQTTVDVIAQAEEAGAASNGLAIGSIHVLVDPIPYMESAENITESSGGTDVEDDDSLTERVFFAPGEFSCAGPADAYEYYARAWRNDVGDVRVSSPEPSTVDVYFVLADGKLPSELECQEMESYFMDETQVKRPLTDLVKCKAPAEVEYTIEGTYYIGSSNRNNVAAIQTAVQNTVAEYQKWQRKLGRDINPTELIARIRDAGAKRLQLTAPAYAVVTETQIAKCTSVNMAYGGLEDD